MENPYRTTRPIIRTLRSRVEMDRYKLEILGLIDVRWNTDDWRKWLLVENPKEET